MLIINRFDKSVHQPYEYVNHIQYCNCKRIRDKYPDFPPDLGSVSVAAANHRTPSRSHVSINLFHKRPSVTLREEGVQGAAIDPTAGQGPPRGGAAVYGVECFTAAG